MTLTGKQRKYLRGLGHGLDPVLRLGRGGLSDAVVAEADRALTARELVKVRFGEGFEGDRTETRAAADELARRTGAELAGTIGRTCLLYRAREDDPEIVLP